MRKITLPLLLLSFVILAVFVYIHLSTQNSLEKDVKAQYLKGGAFTLMHKGATFESSSLKGLPHILYFGFTFCPDVCPVGLATIRDALEADARLSDVKVMFVTVDPERDTPARMDEYTAFFHSNIMGLTGSLEQIAQVAKQYGTYFKKSDKHNQDGNYTVDHTAYYYLLDEHGELMRVLDHSATEKDISELLLKML